MTAVQPPQQSSRDSRAVGFREHLEFFDQDADGAISFAETRRGLERLGFGRLLSVPGSLFINMGVMGLGFAQRRPVRAAQLDVSDAAHVRHPDTRLVDEDGRFDDARLSALFSRYGTQFRGEALTLLELATMLTSRVAHATHGAERLLLPAFVATAVLEWGALFWVGAVRKNGTLALERHAVRRFYTDPQFFEAEAGRLTRERAARRGTARGELRNFVQDWLL